MERIQLKRFLSSSPMWQLLAVACSISLATFALIAFSVKPSGNVLILHYTIPFGIDLIGPWWWFYIYAGANTAIFVINTFVAWLLFFRHKALAYIFVTTSCFVSAIVILATYMIIQQNNL